MKILYIYKSIAQKAGTERILIEKMNYLCRTHEIHIITYEQGEHPLSYSLNPNITHEDLNLRFFTLHKYNKFKRIYEYGRMRHLFKQKLQEYAHKINPDIIICTTYAAPLMGIIRNTACSCNAKWIIEAHTIIEEIKKINDFSNPLAKVVANIWDWHTMKIMSKCDALVTLTTNDAQSWNRIKNVYVIPNSIIYPDHIIDQKEKTVITVGRLEYQKGYDLLIDCWNLVNQQHPDWKLKIFGAGSMRESLLKKIHCNHLDEKIEIIAPIEHIYDEYMKSAIYVSSSRFEGFGLSMAEAMSCATPCVAFDCPYGPKNIIKHNQDGILVENKNIQTLAESINYLITNENIRINMGKNARINIKRYAPEQIMGKWEELFTQV